MNTDFDDIIHKRLANHELAKPPGLWENISSSMGLDIDDDKRNTPLMWRWISASVAALIAAALVFYVLNNQKRTELSVKAKITQTNIIPNTTNNERHPEPGISQNSVYYTKSNATFAQNINTKGQGVGNRTIIDIMYNIVADNIVVQNNVSEFPVVKEDISFFEKQMPTFPSRQNIISSVFITPHLLSRDNKVFSASNNNVKAHRGVELSMSLSGISHISREGKWLDAISAALACSTMPNNDEVHIDYSHHVPIRVGMEVATPIGGKWKLGTGLTYTRLRHKATYAIDCLYKVDGTFHYLGIPINVSHTLWTGKKFSIYGKAGTMIELNLNNEYKKTAIYNLLNQKKTTLHDRDHRPQFSLNAQVGAQYNITNHLGIYVDPGVSYHFDNGSNVYNLYKDKPFLIDLNIGIRLNLEGTSEK